LAPADARAIIDRTGANTGRVLTERIRAMDQGAFNRMKATKTVVEPTPAERAEWSDLWARVRASLRNEGKVGADFFDDVVNAAR
jgi:TRAP-type C4-dicarboxylate transport system substrate-binding protein